MRIPDKTRIEIIANGEHTGVSLLLLYFEGSHGHDVAVHAWPEPTGYVWCQPIRAYMTMEPYQVRQMLELIFDNTKRE